MSLEQAKALIETARIALRDESPDFAGDIDASMNDILSDIDYWITQRDEVEDNGKSDYDEHHTNHKASRGC